MSDDENLMDTDDVSDEVAGTGADSANVTFSEGALALVDKEIERKKLEADVEAFLARGGTIERIDSNVMTDIPKKPESKYGGQPI